MTALDAAIRERLDQMHEDWCDRRDPLMAADDRECNCGMSHFTQALRAVLDLHERVTPRAPVDTATECKQCWDLSAAPWPCPTVLVIARALGVDVPGGTS